MVATVNRIPSINLPLTNEQGMIHPIWYEFLRSFISSVGDTDGGGSAGNTVIAGEGIEGTGAVSTVNVGAGEGIAVGANDVSVNIIGQINAQAALEDEILISDASDLSRIRKTSLRDVAALAGSKPGGESAQIQYNNNDAFGGDTGFTTDGAGSVAITGDLSVDSININGATYASNSSSSPLVFTVPAGGLNQFTFTQSGAGSSATNLNLTGVGAAASVVIRSDSGATSSTANALLSFATNVDTAKWTMGLYDSQDDDFILAHHSDLNIGQILKIDNTDSSITFYTDVFMESSLKKKTTAGITASTTQTQGQGALTADVNQISVCANANDTVTLPAAQAGAEVFVINDGAQTLQIFPASGDNLGAGVDTSTTLAAGGHAMFIAYNTVNWEQFI